MSFVKDAISSAFGGSDSAKAAERGSKVSTDAQRESLEYLKEREALPQQFREGALTGLAGVAGLEGGEGSQQDMIDRAEGSPLYSAITGTREAGEQAILRNASATGGLRSGNSNNALYDMNQRLDERALLESYNQQLGGLQGLANLPSNANQIAGAISGIGQTQAQGITAAGQSYQDALGMGISTAATAAAAFSDRRLKTNIVQIGVKSGLPLYTWDWNKEAGFLDLHGSGEGHIADEVAKVRPEAVGERDGYQTVNYAMLEAAS